MTERGDEIAAALGVRLEAGRAIGRLVLAGAGAGSPTASAVVSDLVDVVAR